MEKNWKSVCLTKGQATFIETIKQAIITEYNIKMSTNDILSRIVAYGFLNIDTDALISNPLSIFQGEV